MRLPTVLVTILAIALFAGCTDTSSAASDTPRTVCDTCRADQICVAKYDGTCRSAVTCVARTVDCPGNACSAACQSAYCDAPYQCQNRAPCGGEPAAAFTCYGP